MTRNNFKLNKFLEISLPDISCDIFSNAYSYETNGVRIVVQPEFIDSQFSGVGNLFIWIYHVRIDNYSNSNIRLVNRYWKIIDEKGTVQEVSGEGVVGEKPYILANNSFQYESGVHLRFPSGIMTGHYQMQKDNGELFNVKIPTFSLDVPNVKSVIN